MLWRLWFRYFKIIEMKLTLATIYLINLTIALQIYSSDAGFFDSVWTANDTKFAIVQVVSLLASLDHYFKKEDSPRPTFIKVLFVLVLNAFFVFLSYEYAIHYQTVVIWAMLGAFFSALASYSIVGSVVKNAPIMINKVFELMPDIITSYISQKFKRK